MNLSEFEDAYDSAHDGELERLHGAVLETPVSDLMVRDPCIVHADTTVAEAVHAMNDRHIGCVLVQEDGKLAGIFTERDLLRRVVFREGNQSWKVSTVMTPDPETLPPSASVAFALNKMSVDGYRHIPILAADGRVAGLVSVKDIVHFVVDFFPEAVFNLPVDPDRAIPKTEDGA